MQSGERAGIGKVGWHTFRHSYRAWLKRFAAPAEIPKELMRHPRTTLEIYGIEPDVAPAYREANTERIGSSAWTRTKNPSVNSCEQGL